MARVHIVVSRTSANGGNGAVLPVPDAIPAQVATVPTTAASQVVATMPSSQSYLICHATAIGGAMWLAFSAEGEADPEAGEGKGWLLQDGETRSFGTGGGQKLAVRDAAL